MTISTEQLMLLLKALTALAIATKRGLLTVVSGIDIFVVTLKGID